MSEPTPPAEPARISIVPGCAGAPPGPVAGVDRVVRLRKMLERRGYEVVEGAEKTIPDCRVLCGPDELHLCELGKPEVERRLLQALRKPIDGIVAKHINRRISLATTRLLMNTGIKPNHVTVFNILLGVAAGVVAALGGYWMGLIGAILLQAQSIFDGTDGELARLRFQSSKIGSWLDTISDDLSNLAYLVGLTISTPYPIVRWIGLGGIAAFVLNQGLLYYVLATVFGTGDLLAFQWEAEGSSRFGWVQRLFKRDFFCLLFLALAVAGLFQVIVVLLSCGTAIVLATLVRQLIRRWPTRDMARVVTSGLDAKKG